jgi:hypothetical protein
LSFYSQSGGGQSEKEAGKMKTDKLEGVVSLENFEITAWYPADDFGSHRKK